MKMSEFENRLREHANTTKNTMQTPFNLKEELKNLEVYTMSKPNITLKKALAIAAVLSLCMITVTITPLANSIKGFFGDIIRFDGAITGTNYENASSEITVAAMEPTTDNGNDILPLELTFKNPTAEPFATIQEIAVSDYMVLDEVTGKILKLECYPEYSGKATIKDGKAVVNLSIDNTEFKSGKEYTIVIEKMYGLAKADSPLHITGTWECSFVR